MIIDNCISQSLFKHDITYIANKANASPTSCRNYTDCTYVELSNGLNFRIFYEQGPDYGFIYVMFNGLKYNYSRFDMRDRLFIAMNQKGSRNANIGGGSGF